MVRIRKIWVLLACALVACAPVGPPLTAEEAQTTLADFARGRAPADVCTPEGRALLRSAVRTHSKAQADAGVAWPDMSRLMNDDSASFDNLDAFVIASVAAGFIEPSDLQGPARTISGFFQASYGAEFGDLRRSAQHACTEVFELHQIAARAAVEERRYAQARERAARRGPHEVREIDARYGPRLERLARDFQRRSAALERKLESAPAS
jgi:hypothetical protein